MNPSPTSAPQRLTGAALLAGSVLLASGLAFRALADAYDASSTPPVLLAGALERLPLKLGDWTGRPRTLDQALVRAADVDSYVLRSYSRFGRESVALYLGFGIRARDLTPHRPEVCYPGSGYTLREQHHVRLTAGASELPARILTFSSAGLGATNVAVLTFYVVDGRVVEDVADVRWRMWRGQGAARYIAQAQFTTAFGLDDQSEFARALLEEFASVAASAVREAVVQAVAEADRDQPTSRADASLDAAPAAIPTTAQLCRTSLHPR
jgi:EpsI family protein